MIWNADYSFLAGDAVMANSNWTSENLKRFCNLTSNVLFPPVLLPLKKMTASKADGYGFIYIGRISPEKEIEKIIAILEKVRELGFPVTLELAGNSGVSDYEQLISAKAMERSWIKDLGYLCGDAKEAAFARNSFGLQACQCEAFGIAAAEMASRGCLPFVPSGCGSAEVVPFPELQYDSINDAVEKIIKLLETPKLSESLRRQVSLGIKRFSSKTFVLNLRVVVDSMLPRREVIPFRTNVEKRKGKSPVN